MYQRKHLPMMTNVQEGESLEETYKNIMNLKEEYTYKMERLHREATGAASEDEEFDSRCLTRIVKEQDEVMVLQLHAKGPDGPVWKRAIIPSRRLYAIQERSTPLLMAVPKEGNRPEGGLVVAGVANKREGKNIFVGDLVVGQLQDHGPWAAEGEVEKSAREDTALWPFGQNCSACIKSDGANI